VAVLTDTGLQQFHPGGCREPAIRRRTLRDKIGQALQAIQANRAKEARTLDLATRGQGRRTVRVAYIVTVPVWKASYRLTLPGDAASPKAALQGWATVENLSGTGLEGSRAGRWSRAVRSAFHQALYEAYYVTRPEVPVEVAGRLNPYIDRGGVAASELRRAAPPPPPAPGIGALDEITRHAVRSRGRTSRTGGRRRSDPGHGRGDAGDVPVPPIR
jgi:hypothetical protein